MSSVRYLVRIIGQISTHTEIDALVHKTDFGFSEFQVEFHVTQRKRDEPTLHNIIILLLGLEIDITTKFTLPYGKPSFFRMI